MADEADPSVPRRLAEWVASTERIHARLRALPPEKRREYLCPLVEAKERPVVKRRKEPEVKGDGLGF